MLTAHSMELDDAALLQVGHRLIDWLVTAISRGDASVTLRKLCSTMAYYCTLNRDVQADSIIRRVVLSVNHGKAIDLTVADLPDSSTSLESLNDAQLSTLLWFLTSLTEEAAKESASKDPRYISCGMTAKN
jgi:hypothetical protein